MLLPVFALFFYFGYLQGTKKHKPGDYDGDGEGFTDKDLGVFQSERNRKNAERRRKAKEGDA